MSASKYYYGKGETKFQEWEIFCSTPENALLIVQDRLRRGFGQFKLCAHFLQSRGECFNLLLQTCDHRVLFLFAVLFEKFIKQHRVHSEIRSGNRSIGVDVALDLRS